MKECKGRIRRKVDEGREKAEGKEQETVMERNDSKRICRYIRGENEAAAIVMGLGRGMSFR